MYFVDSMEYKDFMKYHFRCNAGVDIKSEIFMMDRSTADTPIKIMETPPIEYEYREYRSPLSSVPGTKEISYIKCCISFTISYTMA